MPSVTLAGPVVRSGESVSVEADQLLEGDFYAAAGTVSLSGAAEHDVFVAAGSVTINAEVKEDLVVAGGSVQVHAPVGDDVRIVGGEVVLADMVAGDVVVFGGLLQILSTAHVTGDVIFYGGEAEINGTVDGSVFGTADDMRIDAAIGGDIDMTIGSRFALGARAEVAGAVQYTSAVEMARAPEAVVFGDVHRVVPGSDTTHAHYALIPMLVIIFAALAGYLLFKQHVQGVADTVRSSYGMQGLIGLSVLVSVPLVSVLLLVSILGILPGLMLLFGYVVLVLGAFVVAGMVFGTVLLGLLRKSTQLTALTVVIGVVLFELMSFIPFVGPLLAFVFFLMVLGGITTKLYRALFV